MEKISINENQMFKEDFMDINKMRNIVILKDLPSNLIEEAFVVLKENQKIKKFEYAENKAEKFSEVKDGLNADDYVIKEAELLISNYINKIENQDLIGKKRNNTLIKKYKKLKVLATLLGCFLFLCFIYILNI